MGSATTEHPEDRVGRVYELFADGRSVEVRVLGFTWDAEAGRTLFDVIETVGDADEVGLVFVVADEWLGPERESPYSRRGAFGPLSEDPVFIRVADQ